MDINKLLKVISDILTDRYQVQITARAEARAEEPATAAGTPGEAREG